jgi:hypothetical protein
MCRRVSSSPSAARNRRDARRYSDAAELFGKRISCVCGDEVTIRLPSQSSGDVAKVVTVEPRRTAFARTDSRGRTNRWPPTCR